jgi:two-component system, chemotaxis family, protein-glutamate methylesterase/glutaminase
MIPRRNTRVLVVDDSAVVRRALVNVLSRDPEIEVVGTAENAYEARNQIVALHPDVVTLDLEMPGMDGLTFLRILQSRHPLPVVIVSSQTPSGSAAALAALEAGAVEVLSKPTTSWGCNQLRDQLAQKVKAAARARIRAIGPSPVAPVSRARPIDGVDPRQVILIGASTGGTEALRQVLTQLPDGLPPICIVQHIPPKFSTAFAQRLNASCAFEVREAVEGDTLHPGLGLVAPGDFHLRLQAQGRGYRVQLDQSPPLHHTRPSVDALFDSAAHCAGAHVIAVLLTGMGSDGALGMQTLKAHLAYNIAQDEDSCVVYGMPRAAVELGVVDEQVALERIPEAILRAVARSAHPESSPGHPQHSGHPVRPSHSNPLASL